MAIEDSYSGVVIHWGGEYWTPTESGELEPLAVMYHSLVKREDYVEIGLELHRRYLNSYFASPLGRRVRAAGMEALVRSNRMQIRQWELEQGIPNRFDGKYQELCDYALTFGLPPQIPSEAE